MKKRLYLTLLAFLAVFTVNAQVITWAVKPGMYTKIEPCWGDMYYVYNGNSMGVINGDGTVIVPVGASRASGFYGGLELLIKSAGGQERILGILSTDGTYTEVDGTYYTIPGYEFFSDGFLTIKTQRGRAGFMDTNGRVVKEYDDAVISPFSEGYATVEESGNFSIVDKRFNALQISLNTMSPLWGGANVFNGVAIVWDGNGNVFEFNPQKSGPCIRVKDKTVLNVLKSSDYTPLFDYLGCIAQLTNRSDKITYEQLERSSLTMTVSEQGGKSGYVKNGKVLLPYQLEQAENFYGSRAVVKLNGKYGLLSLRNSDDWFDATANSEIKYKKSAAKDLIHKFGVTIPAVWSEENMTVKVKDENGIPVSVDNDGGAYEFKADGATGTKKYAVEIDCEGLKLWEGDIAYNYTVEKEPDVIVAPISIGNFKSLSVRLEKGNTHANEKNLCSVKAIITNPNPKDITTTVMWSGSSLLEGSNTSVTVPANGTRVVNIYLKVLKANTERQSVTVSTKAGGSDTISGLQLIPF